MTPGIATQIKKGKDLAEIHGVEVDYIVMRPDARTTLNRQSPTRIRPTHILGMEIQITHRPGALPWEIRTTSWKDKHGRYRTTINSLDIESETETIAREMIEAHPLYATF